MGKSPDHHRTGLQALIDPSSASSHGQAARAMTSPFSAIFAFLPVWIIVVATLFCFILDFSSHGLPASVSSVRETMGFRRSVLMADLEFKGLRK